MVGTGNVAFGWGITDVFDDGDSIFGCFGNGVVMEVIVLLVVVSTEL